MSPRIRFVIYCLNVIKIWSYYCKFIVIFLLSCEAAFVSCSPYGAKKTFHKMQSNLFLPKKPEDTGAGGGSRMHPYKNNNLPGAALPVQAPTELDSQRMNHMPAIVLKTMGLFDIFADTLFDGKQVRQMAEGQKDENGTNVSRYICVSDAGKVLLFEEASNARKWSKNKNQVNIEIAPSLTFVASGQPRVSFLKLT